MDRLKDLGEIYDNDSFSRFLFTGYVEKSLPVTIVLGREENELKGFIYYGQNGDRFDLEGTMSDAGDIELYEFDNYFRVSGSITGNILRPKELFTWYSADHSLQLSIVLYPSKMPDKIIELFEANNINSRSQIFFRGDLQQISIDPSGDINLRWIDYLCEGADCYESRPNTQISNPVEFYIDTKEHKTLLVYPDNRFTKYLSLPYANKSAHNFSSYASHNYPMLNNEAFDKWVQDNLKISSPLIPLDESSYSLTSTRFSKRTTSDFYITLLSTDLISGYLYQQSTEGNRVISIPFIFDREKSKFYQIQDLFKKNFDYSFFIEKYVEKIKRGRLIKENRLVQTLLKKEDFKHYVLAPEGILFFTDFHVVFGRRHILVPFEELISSIDNKALENYLKKQKT
jgi:hypothetical protein